VQFGVGGSASYCPLRDYDSTCDNCIIVRTRRMCQYLPCQDNCGGGESAEGLGAEASCAAATDSGVGVDATVSPRTVLRMQPVWHLGRIRFLAVPWNVADSTATRHHHHAPSGLMPALSESPQLLPPPRGCAWRTHRHAARAVKLAMVHSAPPLPPLAGNGRCVEGRCVCADGWTGDYCSQTTLCAAVATATGTGPCSPAADCTLTNTTLGDGSVRQAARCTCRSGYTGPGHTCTPNPTFVDQGYQRDPSEDVVTGFSITAVVVGGIGASLLRWPPAGS
jgi:hypothetical protein